MKKQSNEKPAEPSMTGKPTPGAWAFTVGEHGRHEMTRIHKADDPDYLIAYVITDSLNMLQRADDLANARLVAAAPDLLNACKTAFDCLENIMKAVPWGKTFDLDVGELNDSMLKLPKAIAKAEGRAS